MPHINHHRGETRRSVNREVRCSCAMCGNPRRNGWDNQPTRQELKADLDLKIPRHWPRTKKDPKFFAVEKRRVSRKGQPEAWWQEMKRYRTERDRDNALEGLHKSVRSYTWPGYTGPCCEFRVAE